MKYDGWKNNNLCLEDDMKPPTNNIINLQSIYIICLEGDIMSNPNYYFDEEYLISELKRFHGETGKIPNTSNMSGEFLDYPSSYVFERLFGTFNDAVRKAGFEPKISTTNKGKKAERIVKNSLEMLEDTSRKDWFAPYDLICSKGYKVDVKGSSLNTIHTNAARRWAPPLLYWSFSTKKNICADYFILVGFDTKFNKVKHVWIFKNDDIIKSKQAIHIQENKIKHYKQHEWDLNKCNMDMTLDLYTY